MSLEYRLTWSASSNISFHGETDWEPVESDETREDAAKALIEGGSLPQGLEEVLDASGFAWDVEFRESTAA